MIEVMIKLFSYLELSPTAKSRALGWWRAQHIDRSYLDEVMKLAERVFSVLGFANTRFTVQNSGPIRFSGVWNPVSNTVAETMRLIRELVPNDNELHKTVQRLLQIDGLVGKDIDVNFNFVNTNWQHGVAANAAPLGVAYKFVAVMQGLRVWLMKETIRAHRIAEDELSAIKHMTEYDIVFYEDGTPYKAEIREITSLWYDINQLTAKETVSDDLRKHLNHFQYHAELTVEGIEYIREFLRNRITRGCDVGKSSRLFLEFNDWYLYRYRR